MSDPRVLSEIDVPDNIYQIPPQPAQVLQQQQQIAPPPPRPSKPPPTLALVYNAIARMLAARLMSLVLVVAMVVLSYMAVDQPTVNRLLGAAGFDVFALLGIYILGRAQPQG